MVTETEIKYYLLLPKTEISKCKSKKERKKEKHVYDLHAENYTVERN